MEEKQSCVDKVLYPFDFDGSIVDPLTGDMVKLEGPWETEVI